MSGETEANVSGWTVDTLHALMYERDGHARDMRELEQRFGEERDRRYTEVNIEKEKALKIKETADLAALSLARDIQIYKDEKANELREQISAERGEYLSRTEYTVQHQALEDLVVAGLKPLNEFMTEMRSRSLATREGWDTKNDTRTMILGAIGILVAIGVVISPHIH